MITKQGKENSTTKKTDYDLIKGEFTAEDAAEIISDLFYKKINFHERKNFSQQIRFGSKDVEGLERIKVLKRDQEKAMEFIADARQSGKSVKVSSIISIELI